jgi:glycosyltransferase involved in cell wall biosynthesis
VTELKKPDSQIKVAFVDHSPEIGGAESSLLTLLHHMDKNQFNATVVLTSEGIFSKRLREENIQVKVIYLPWTLIRLKRGNALKAFLFLAAYLFPIQFFMIKLCFYLRKNKFDLILTNTIKAHFYGSIAARLCFIPVIWRFHDILSPADFSPVLIQSIIFFGKRFPTRILAVSDLARDYLMRDGLKGDKIEVIFSGIDNERYEFKNTSRNIRNEFNIGDNAKLVGCIGRIIPQKGQRSFLLAIPEVIKKYPETFFLIVGDVYLKEERYKEELLEIMKKNKIEGRVKFTGFRYDIGNLIRSLDILVFPSVAPESFGLSVLEAMSLGKPVIASKVGGVCEIIEDGVNGMLIEPNHPEQITDRIIQLLSDKEMYHRMGWEAKEAVTRKFSLKRYVVEMERACKEVSLREVSH